MPNRNNPQPGLATFDAERDNPLAEIAELKRRLDAIERWAMPIGAKWPLPNPPALEAWRTTALSVNENTTTPVTALTDQYNEEGLELESGNIIKLRRDSEVEWYHFSVIAEWAASANGFRTIVLEVRNINTGVFGALTTLLTNANSSDKVHVTNSFLYRMSSTADAVRFSVLQSNGGSGALNLNLFLVNAMLVKSGDVIAS